MLRFGNYLLTVFMIAGAALILLFYLIYGINGHYTARAGAHRQREVLLQKIHTASPATITGGRNIAFETGNAVTNAPASYLTLLDCCEADEAISGRLAIGETKCTVIKKQQGN